MRGKTQILTNWYIDPAKERLGALEASSCLLHERFNWRVLRLSMTKSSISCNCTKSKTSTFTISLLKTLRNRTPIAKGTPF
jgi:hypothetical protein